ncbi:MAG: biotin--[acetyl-CoA-carboxylase] ligase [Lachnospiraceae bacterium]|nr:biotin--[acetyl-CoA-carboxylase] ligase [Lachnospiraceae bacterium]
MESEGALKNRILKQLKESGEYLSGQRLCEMFGVSRTAVWKAVGALKKEGYRIDSVQNLGYKLLESPEIYGAEQIKEELTTQMLAEKVIFFEETGSTNTDCRALMEQEKCKNLLVAAANQNAGKGRRGRSWEAPKDTSISFSLGLCPDIPVEKASMLTLVMALAVKQAIDRETGLKTQIKWPNDIITGGKKICGILTEMNLEMNSIDSVIIGVGINYGQKSFAGELEDKATSLVLAQRSLGTGLVAHFEPAEQENAKSEPVEQTQTERDLAGQESAGQLPSRARITAACINQFEPLYKQFLKDQNLAFMKDEYEACMVNKDRQVCVLDPKETYAAVAKGITPEGELMVEKEDGTKVQVYAGEVSVRGVYGYV